MTYTIIDAETDEELGIIDSEGLTDHELLEELAESDYIDSINDFEIREGVDGDKYVYEGRNRVLILEPIEDDDEDPDDDLEDDEDLADNELGAPREVRCAAHEGD